MAESKKRIVGCWRITCFRLLCPEGAGCSALKERSNLMFYRLGLAMVRRRWLILGVWLLAIAVALPFAPRITSVLASGGFSCPDMESQQAVDLLVQKLHYQFNAVQIIFSSPTLTADDPRFIQEVDATLAELSKWSE